MDGERKHSKYELCERHTPWFAGETRGRILECMVEGGPGGWSPGCAGGRCRLWPGRDVFCAEVCSGELDLEWTRPAVETFNRESFELCARKNLEHALEVVEAAAELEPPGKLPRIRHESAAATIRELLQPESHYFEAAPAA